MVDTIFLVFTGAAILATLALYARQALLVAHIALGVLVGPAVLGLVDDPAAVEEAAHVGIIFLLFLLGLNLPPAKLVQLFRETMLVTLLSSSGFALIGFVLAKAFGFHWLDSLIIGSACMFSSTILGLKLLPTTVLHHRHTGEIIISILLLQDLLAILVLLLLQVGGGTDMLLGLIQLGFGLIVVLVFAFGFERLILIRLIRRFDKIQEYIFLVAIGWCLGVAELATVFGLSAESGAFIAGVALATSPIALFIAESLKPVRDFFLVLFFFSLGARFELAVLGSVLLPAVVITIVLMVAKPLSFSWLLQRFAKEEAPLAQEVGMRLGQVSEFSLFIALIGVTQGLLSEQASYLIQAVTLLSFIVSSYFIVLRYPTPIAVSDRLRRD